MRDVFGVVSCSFIIRSLEEGIYEFHDLRQLTIIVEQYEHNLFELKKYVRIEDDEAMLVQHFVRGTNNCISGGVRVFEPKTMEVVMEKVHLVEENLAITLGGQT